MVLVFKTNLAEKDLPLVEVKLGLSQEIEAWNCDIEDCDKVLRIVSKVDITTNIISIIKKCGFCCEELT